MAASWQPAPTGVPRPTPAQTSGAVCALASISAIGSGIAAAPHRVDRATETPDAETIKAFNQSIVEEFRANDGKVGGQFARADLLLLTTTGAKSGQPRLSPLAYLRIDGKLIIIGSFAGSDVNPGWVHNLRANPSAHVEIGADSFDISARELPPEERDAAFSQVTAAAPGFADYQAKTSRIIPLFELQPMA